MKSLQEKLESIKEDIARIPTTDNFDDEGSFVPNEELKQFALLFCQYLLSQTPNVYIGPEGSIDVTYKSEDGRYGLLFNLTKSLQLTGYMSTDKKPKIEEETK